MESQKGGCRSLVKSDMHGKPAPGAESHYEFCCSFPPKAHTLHALERLIFIKHRTSCEHAHAHFIVIARIYD